MTTTELQPCATARERYGPGKRFKLAEYEKHVKSCPECARFQRATRKAQRTTSEYSRAYPLTGDVHKYLLVVPRDLWQRFDKQRGRKSARSTLNRLIDYFAANGMPTTKLP